MEFIESTPHHAIEQGARTIATNNTIYALIY